MSDELERTVEAVGDDRRAFLRKVVIGSAFAVPVVSSFTMSGIQAVYAQTPTTSAPRTTPSSSTTTTSPNTTTTSTTTSTTTTTSPNQPPA